MVELYCGCLVDEEGIFILGDNYRKSNCKECKIIS